MGRVFLVRHKATGARRALKVLEGAFDGEMIARFKREAEALARLEGKGVVPIHETSTEKGRFGFVMDWMSGGSLEKRLAERGRFEWREAAATVAKLARTLERCSALGLVHRDVKPANVLYDDQGEPRLADFGCVRDLGASRLTETGAAVGTPAYMAPEQWDAGKVDARADVFSLGAVLYELVAGERPHQGASAYAVQVAARLGERRKARELADVPAALDAVIERALAAEPARRQAGPGELARELEAVLAGEKVAAARPALGRGVLALLAVAALSVVATGALVATRGGPGPPPPTPLAPPRPPAAIESASRSGDAEELMKKAIAAVRGGNAVLARSLAENAGRLGVTDGDRGALRKEVVAAIRGVAQREPLWWGARPEVVAKAVDEVEKLEAVVATLGGGPSGELDASIETLAKTMWNQREASATSSRPDGKILREDELALMERLLGVAPCVGLARDLTGTVSHREVPPESRNHALAVVTLTERLGAPPGMVHFARGRVLLGGPAPHDRIRKELEEAVGTADLDADDRFKAERHLAELDEADRFFERAAPRFEEAWKHAPDDMNDGGAIRLRLRLLVRAGLLEKAREAAHGWRWSSAANRVKTAEEGLRLIIATAPGPTREGAIDELVADLSLAGDDER